MKTYNYYYYKTPITKSQFLKNVPQNWESEYNDLKGYFYGGYTAIER